MHRGVPHRSFSTSFGKIPTPYGSSGIQLSDPVQDRLDKLKSDFQKNQGRFIHQPIEIPKDNFLGDYFSFTSAGRQDNPDYIRPDVSTLGGLARAGVDIGFQAAHNVKDLLPYYAGLGAVGAVGRFGGPVLKTAAPWMWKVAGQVGGSMAIPYATGQRWTPEQIFHQQNLQSAQYKEDADLPLTSAEQAALDVANQQRWATLAYTGLSAAPHVKGYVKPALDRVTNIFRHGIAGIPNVPPQSPNLLDFSGTAKGFFRGNQLQVGRDASGRVVLAKHFNPHAWKAPSQVAAQIGTHLFPSLYPYNPGVVRVTPWGGLGIEQELDITGQKFYYNEDTGLVEPVPVGQNWMSDEPSHLEWYKPEQHGYDTASEVVERLRHDREELAHLLDIGGKSGIPFPPDFSDDISNYTSKDLGMPGMVKNFGLNPRTGRWEVFDVDTHTAPAILTAFGMGNISIDEYEALQKAAESAYPDSRASELFKLDDVQKTFAGMSDAEKLELFEVQLEANRRALWRDAQWQGMDENKLAIIEQEIKFTDDMLQANGAYAAQYADDIKLIRRQMEAGEFPSPTHSDLIKQTQRVGGYPFEGESIEEWLERKDAIQSIPLPSAPFDFDVTDTSTVDPNILHLETLPSTVEPVGRPDPHDFLDPAKLTTQQQREMFDDIYNEMKKAGELEKVEKALAQADDALQINLLNEEQNIIRKHFVHHPEFEKGDMLTRSDIAQEVDRYGHLESGGWLRQRKYKSQLLNATKQLIELDQMRIQEENDLQEEAGTLSRNLTVPSTRVYQHIRNDVPEAFEIAEEHIEHMFNAGIPGYSDRDPLRNILMRAYRGDVDPSNYSPDEMDILESWMKVQFTQFRHWQETGQWLKIGENLSQAQQSFGSWQRGQ